MTAKEHYDQHLGNFYSWMTGDFNEKQREQQNFFAAHKIIPFASRIAFDLGAGHGLQSVSLANLGFSVTAIDFNVVLLDELHRNKKGHTVHIVKDDILQHLESNDENAELIVCMGDTLTHFSNLSTAGKVISEIQKHLIPGGKIILSFRDLTNELKGEQRFIPVKSDDTRILTCFLEYFADHVMVHDILHEKQDGRWCQKISSYPKLRISEKLVEEWLTKYDFNITHKEVINRMNYIIAAKK